MIDVRNTELECTWLIDKTKWTDYRLSGEDKQFIPFNTNVKKFYYNQAEFRGKVTSDVYNEYEETRFSCALFWTMWTISDLTGYEFTKEDILAINRSAIDDYGLSIPWGMWFYQAVDCVRHYWNDVLKFKRLASFRAIIWDEIYTELMSKNHSVIVWYKTSTEYYNDSQDNWVLEGEDFDIGWGHCVRNNHYDFNRIEDNYEWLKEYNDYDILHLEKLKENGVYFASAYYFLYEEEESEFKYKSIFDQEVETPIFNEHLGSETLKEADIKYLLEIWMARLEERMVKDYNL